MQHRNAKLIFLLYCLLTIGFIGLNEVLTDCLPCCPDFVGGGSCPYGQIIGTWPVCCTKTLGLYHVGCCDYIKVKVQCPGGSTITFWVLEKRHFNTSWETWFCITDPSTNTGRCHRVINDGRM
jgi:hypothetical protein